MFCKSMGITHDAQAPKQNMSNVTQERMIEQKEPVRGKLPNTYNPIVRLSFWHGFFGRETAYHNLGSCKGGPCALWGREHERCGCSAFFLFIV